MDICGYINSFDNPRYRRIYGKFRGSDETICARHRFISVREHKHNVHCTLFIAVIVGSSNLVYSLSIAALLFINVLFHVGGSIRLRGYNAGLVTAVVLYLPVSIYAYYYFWNNGSLTPFEFILSILLGAFWMVIVFIHQFIQISIKRKQLTD